MREGGRRGKKKEKERVFFVTKRMDAKRGRRRNRGMIEEVNDAIRFTEEPNGISSKVQVSKMQNERIRDCANDRISKQRYQKKKITNVTIQSPQKA